MVTDAMIEAKLHGLIEAARMYEASCQLGGKDQEVASVALDKAKSNVATAIHAARPIADPGEYGELDLPPTLYSEADQDDVPARLRPHLKAAADRLETQAATIARLREVVEAAVFALRNNGYPETAAELEHAALSPNPTSP
jgi:hypothetical protein